MEEAVVETQKRLEIVNRIADQIEDSVIAIVLGGSMGYGQNVSVNKNSDIDMVVICDKESIGKLLSKQYFAGFDLSTPKNLFLSGKIGFFWVTKMVDGVEVNMFVYEKAAYENFCLFKEDLVAYRFDRPSEVGKGHLFDGSLIEFDQKVTKTDKGFIYRKPALFEGKYWDAVPRYDFINSYFVVYDPQDFWKGIDKKIWGEIARLLIDQYGQNPDLRRVGPLHAHWIYRTAPTRLPVGFAESVIDRTKRELALLQSS